jgi:hypothetical protein
MNKVQSVQELYCAYMDANPNLDSFRSAITQTAGRSPKLNNSKHDMTAVQTWAAQEHELRSRSRNSNNSDYYNNSSNNNTGNAYEKSYSSSSSGLNNWTAMMSTRRTSKKSAVNEVIDLLDDDYYDDDLALSIKKRKTSGDDVSGDKKSQVADTSVAHHSVVLPGALPTGVGNLPQQEEQQQQQHKLTPQPLQQHNHSDHVSASQRAAASATTATKRAEDIAHLQAVIRDNEVFDKFSAQQQKSLKDRLFALLLL